MRKKVRSQESEVRSRGGEGREPSPEPRAFDTQPLLLEIGCEEIPARFLADAQKRLGERLASALLDLRLIPDDRPAVETCSTPRRLIARAPQVLARQADRVEETTGPPVKAAFDAAGKPTRAAESFAQKSGVRLEDLVRVTTPKGEYVAARKTIRGRSALELLAQALPGVIVGIPFPKSMYWTSKSGPRFSRPIRWLLALLGEGKNAKVVPFEIAGVASGNKTFGHRLDGAKAILVTGFADLQKKLRAAHVEIDPENRRQMIRNASQVLLEHSERLVEDADLETWHVNSTEWPSAIAGNFDPKFLRLPKEILVTVMRDHQKYFAVEDTNGNLRPRFVAMLNRRDDPKGLIRAGHERVLRARFTDAEFFWDTDQKVPLRDRLPVLERVTYHEKLGSYADKVRRMKTIGEQVCVVLEQQGKLSPAQKSATLRAIELSKCDLTTQMVKEFTELQGIVGGLYAEAQGEPAEVAEAIYDQYKPAGFDERCPRSVPGAIVSLADKLDSVIEGFRAGLEPTGSSDPFGLRRAGNGVVKIAIEALPGLDLGYWVNKVAMAPQGIAPTGARVPATIAVGEFLRERAEYYLRTSGGLRTDTVRAVVHSLEGWSSPSDALLRGRALEPFVTTEAFQALAIAAKRTRNILSKSATQSDRGEGVGIKEELLSAGPERDLFEAYSKLKGEIKNFASHGMYGEAFAQVAEIRPVVDRFFDNVMVMDENLELRANRLQLLDNLNALVFLRFADLSQIESAASTVGAPTKAVAGDK